MISPSTAALAIAIARGAIKFGQRLDALLAEKAAVQGAMPLLMPGIYDGPIGFVMARELKKYLADTEDGDPLDPLGADRAELAEILTAGRDDAASQQFITQCYARVFPERMKVKPFCPDAKYVDELRRLLPGFDLSDPDCLAAAFYLTAGKDTREVGYTARVGLLVADVVAEFGAQNASLFVRDEGVRQITAAVLTRFAQPQLEDFTAWSPLLRHALGATLNGLLDARAALLGDTQWLTALLDVLAEARKDPAGGDEFLIGLFQGRGYALLISKGLSRAAEALSEDDSEVFKKLAADVLKAAAPLAAQSKTFKGFFAEHWGDLLRASLQSLERHGPALLEDQPELLRDVLVSMVHELNDIAPGDWFSHETLFRIGDAAIAAVAANPDLLLAKVDGKPWLRAFLESFVATVARDGLGRAFSREGLEHIVTDAAGVFAEHPELITDAKNAGLVRAVVGGILRSVSRLPSLEARQIATAAASGALQGLAENPDLLGTKYPTVIADFCKQLAGLVEARTLTALDASAIAEVAIAAVLRNPELFNAATSNLASAVVLAVTRAADGSKTRHIAGATLVNTIREVLAAVTQSGRPQLANATLNEAVNRLAEIVETALTAASKELGAGLDLRGVPTVIGGVVAAWTRGELPDLDPKSEAFRELLRRLLALVRLA